MQSIYFCRQVGVAPVIYIPEHTKFLMYFENTVVQIDLDNSYLTASDTSARHAAELVEQGGFEVKYYTPKNYTASTLPDINTDFDYMCCPRSISDKTSKIGIGNIGPKVRNIVKAATFPILLTSPVFKEWHSITVFFGGSSNALNALRLGLRISESSGMPLNIVTQLEKGNTRSDYEKMVKGHNMGDRLNHCLDKWIFFDKGKFEENLYDVPHDSLVVLGAYGHGLIRDILFGSKMELIHSTIYNNLLIVGPNYVANRLSLRVGAK
jgi:hypothetical protein